MGKKLTTFEFIEKAKKIHGDKYDYSKVNYTGTKNNIIIICPIHGKFEQFPNNHLNNNGCQYCGHIRKGQSLKRDLLFFIKKSNNIHNNKYCYDNVNYINLATNIIIICPVHGPFNQSPKNHIYAKQGCPKCTKKFQKLTHANFIRNNMLFDYFYSIENLQYTKHILIKCKKHNKIFKQTPKNHILGKIGCSMCMHESRINKHKEKFITTSNKIHNNKYDYSKIIYINSYTNVEIICPIHGSFWQLPKVHKNKKCNCPECLQLSKGELFIQSYCINNNIKNKKQKTFDNCKNKIKLRFDFYLEELNICIEYDGEQHFKPILFFGGKESFKKIQINDNIKTKFCKDNNIKLIRFNYKQTENEIKEILNEITIK